MTLYTRGLSHFVTSMTAPVASGWSDGRVGLASTKKRRLTTAHTHNLHSLTDTGHIRCHAVASEQPSNVLILGKQVKRRLAAILVADVVGYSRLIGADEAGTLTMLRELSQQSIAHQLHDAAMMALQRRLDQVLSERAQRGERTGFVRTDEARIGNHIRSQNCRQSPLHRLPQ